MKKLVSVLISVIMLMSLSVSAFASDWDFLEKRYTTYSMTTEFWVENNKPIDMLDELSDEAGADLDTFYTELCNTKVKADVKANLSEDYLKGQVYVSYTYNLPVKFSENFKIDALLKDNMWVDYDLSSEENLKVLSIRENVFTGKYDYTKIEYKDLDDEEKAELPVVIDMLKLISTRGLDDVASVSKKAFEKYADLKAGQDGYMSVTLSNDAVTDILFDTLIGMVNSKAIKSVVEYAELDIASLDVTAIDSARDVAKSLGIFAEKDAYTMKIMLDDSGYVKECLQKLHFDFNIAEVALALGEDEEYIKPATLENSNVDITLCAKTAFSDVNKTVSVQMPNLTEENSRDLVAEMEKISESYGTYEYIPPTLRANGISGYSEDKRNYVNAAEFLSKSEHNYDTLTGTTTVDEFGNLTFTLSSDYIGTVTVTGNTYSDKYMLNNEIELWCTKPFEVVDSVLYVNVDVLTAVLDCRVDSYNVNYIYEYDEYGTAIEKISRSYRLERPNPGYPEESVGDFQA